MRLVGTAVLRGCRRAPRPRHGRRLRVDLIAHSKLADRPGPAGHRRGRRVVCKGSRGLLTTRSQQSTSAPVVELPWIVRENPRSISLSRLQDP